MNLAHLQPGRRSNAGFLGKGEQFEDVVAKDSQTLAELGVTHEDIAERLRSIITAPGKKDGRVTIIDDAYKLKGAAWMGYQDCPWDDDERTDLDYFVEQIATGREISFSGLLPHLIADHKFFEGRGTRYRLDPLEAILVLDIDTNATRAEVEERLFQEVTADLQSQYKAARKHALGRLAWFTERDDVGEYVLQFIQGMRDSADEKHSSSEFWDNVKLLIELGHQLPDTAEHIYGLLDVLNDDNDICGFVERDLRKFKRDVEGTTHPNMISGSYWPDYVEFKRGHTPEGQLQEIVEYVGKNNVTVDDVAERGASHWAAYVEVARRTWEKGNPTKTFRGKIQHEVWNRNNTPKYFLDAMEEHLPYLNGTDESPTVVEKRVHFYEMARDVAALQIAPLKFRAYEMERERAMKMLAA